MADTPGDEDKTELPPLGWLDTSASTIPPYLSAKGAAMVAVGAMGFSSFVYVPPADGYVPDPHDDPIKLLDLFVNPPIADGILIAQLKVLHELVGELSSRVSELELGWYLAFICLMPQTPRQVIDSLINTQRNSEGQRQMIMAVARAVLPKDSDFLAFFGKLKKGTDALMGQRNDAIHCVLRILGDTNNKQLRAVGPTKPSSLSDKHIENELRTRIADADRLLLAIRQFLQYADTCGLPSPALVCPQPKAGWRNPLLDNTAT